MEIKSMFKGIAFKKGSKKLNLNREQDREQEC